MLSDTSRKVRPGFRSSAPERLGVMGLCACIAFVVILTLLGPAGKSTFWLQSQLVVLGVATVLALFLVGSSVIKAVKHRSASMSFAPLLVAGALAFLGWGMLYPSYRSAREEIAAANEIVGFTHAILAYVRHHAGRFPESLVDLVKGGYVRKGRAGDWEVLAGPEKGTCRLRNPAWFDVAWGIDAADIGTDGVVKGQHRLVVRPAPGAPSRGFESVCRMISKSLGQHLTADGE